MSSTFLRSAVLTTTVGALAAATLIQTTTDDVAAAPVEPLALWGQVHAATAETVTLRAYAWPNDDVLATLSEGDAVPMHPVPIEVQGTSYEVRVDPASVPSTHVRPEGLDIEVIAVGDDGSSASYSETLVPTARETAWRRSRVARVGLDAARSARTRSLRSLRAPGNLVLGKIRRNGRVTLSAPVLAEASARDICGHYTDGSHIERVKISDVMPAVNDMKGRVTYAQGSKHELGIGVKSASGSASAGGTRTVSTTETVVPSWGGSDHTAKTDWKYVDYVQTCSRQRTARPIAVDGGYFKPSRSRPSYTHCKRYAPLELWERDQNEAWTYAAGVSFWGLNLSAQVGYNSKTALQYSFPDKARWLCGNNATPPTAKLVAGYASDQG